ncbi:MAG: type II secretion system F family protein [Marinobacterium sp.]|nr:type II secretion system F family protein [Marinobacterium sp.]
MLFISSALMLSGALLLMLMRRRGQRLDLLNSRLLMIAPAATAGFNRRSRKQRPEGQPQRHAALRQAEASRSEKVKLQQMLQQAGFRSPDALRWLVTAKLCVALLLALASWLLLPQPTMLLQLLFAIVALVLGSMLPEFYLQRRAKEISGKISATVPDAMDLLVICLEAGMNIDRAFRRVGEELRTVAPDLSRELLATEAELQVLPDRQKVMEDLAWRVQVEEVEQMVFTLIQAERFGSPVAPTLRQLAADMRHLQLLRLEERLGKIPARMSLPLMLLIMFPLVVLIAGPPIITLIRSLQ